MKFSSSSRGSILPTTTLFLILVGVLNDIIPHPLVANAQELFVECQTSVDGNGVTVNACLLNRPSPLTFVADGGATTVTLGTTSAAAVSCEAAVPRSVATCVCLLLVNPSDPLVEADFCTSCTVTVISNTTYDNIFDCSNRLPVGDCVGIDASGNCVSNVDVATPMATPAAAPVAVPTPTVDVPTTPAPMDVTTTMTPIPPTIAPPVVVEVPVDTPPPTTLPPVAVETTRPSPTTDVEGEDCEGKGKGGMMSGKGGMMSSGKGKGDAGTTTDDTSGKGMMKGSKKDKKKKCKKAPKEPKVPKVDDGSNDAETQVPVAVDEEENVESSSPTAAPTTATGAVRRQR